MKRYKGLGRVFSFTLTQQLRQRGWRTATIAVALACLLIPILSLTVAAQHQKNAAPEQNPVMEEGYTQEALDRAELTPEQRALLTAPVEVTVTGGQTGEGEAMGLLSMLLPFASLMLLYFLVLLYGQSTAASVILEKTSKLMDLFLVSVEPGAMVLGKVLATALAGLLQLAVWAAGLAGGFAIGGAVVRQTGVTLPLLEVLKGVGRLTGLFSVPAMLEAAGLLLAGFLLMGQRYALLLAAVTALVDALPVFGTGTVLLPWAAVCLLAGQAPRAVALAALYAVISAVRSLLEPKVMAAQAGLPPLAALAAMYAGFRALGVAGMILLPMALLFVKQLHDEGYVGLWK